MLDVQVDDVEGVVFDEFAAVLDVFAHERCKDFFGFDDVLEFYLQERAGIRVYSGSPEWRRVHFAQALEARDGEIFLCVFHHVAEDIGGLFLRSLVTISRNDEGRLVVLLDLTSQGAQALVFGGGSQRPMDFLIVRRAKLDFVEAVLFVEGDLAFELEFGLFDFLEEFLEGFLFLEVGFFVESAFGEDFDQPVFLQAASELGGGGVIFLDIQEEAGEAGSLEGDTFLGFYDMIFGGTLHQLTGKIALVADVAFALATLDAIERRLSDVDVTTLNEFLHMTEEEGEKECANV